MDRADRAGLTLAVVGHAGLLGVLSLTLLQPKLPPAPKPRPIEVTLAPDVALEAKAPQSVTPPSAARAPEVAPPEEAAPPPPVPEAVPQPVPPRPAPATPSEARSARQPSPKPAPAPRPAEVAPSRPRPAVAPPKPAPAPSTPPRATAAPAPAPARSAAQGGGRTATAPPTAHQRASHLGPDFLKDLSVADTRSTSPAPQAAKVDANALASIIAAIERQIQPCADRQVDPGPGANQISITLDLRLNPDGTLASTPTVVGSPRGVTDENSRYVQRVRDLGIAAFKGCSPLHLPAEYYQTANGGWSNIHYNWKLR